MSWAAKLVILLAIFAAGAAFGIKWQLGVQARADVLIGQVRALDAEKQRLAGDAAAINHAVALAAINQKLGSANAYIAKLSERECFSAGTVGVLNSTSGEPVPAAALDSARSSDAVAPSAGLRFATERDGYRFKGRGLIQTTGRANYQATGDALGVDLLTDPTRLAEPELAARSAGWFWKEHGLNELADAGDFFHITRRINGGINGMDDRLALYAVAKEVLA